MENVTLLNVSLCLYKWSLNFSTLEHWPHSFGVCFLAILSFYAWINSILNYVFWILLFKIDTVNNTRKQFSLLFLWWVWWWIEQGNTGPRRERQTSLSGVKGHRRLQSRKVQASTKYLPLDTLENSQPKCSLSANHFSKGCARITQSSQYPYNVGTAVMATLQRLSLRLRGVKWLAQGCSASTGWSWPSNLGLPTDPQAHSLCYTTLSTEK